MNFSTIHLSWLLTVFLFVGAEASELLYTLDLGAPAIVSQIKKCPYAKVEKDFEHTDVLTVTVPSGEGKGMQCGIFIPIDFQKTGIAGRKIAVEYDLCYSGVTRPEREYNGVKCQLNYKFNGSQLYPDFYTPQQGFRNRFGTIRWTRGSGFADIPAGVARGVLFLGLQDASGTISYKNFRIYDAGKAPVSTLTLTPSPRANYTIPHRPGRGVMSPFQFSEEDFADLQKWGANLIRWQLNVAVRPYDFETWKIAIEKKAEELRQVLDAGKKYGVMVIIDLHTSAGRQILETSEGQAFLIEFWEGIAKRWKNHPALYGYDLANEPHPRYRKPGQPSWHELSERAVKAIRAIDPVTPIFVSSDNMGAPQSLEFNPILPYDNIVYTFHFYHPGDLTHQLDTRQASFNGYPTWEWNKESLKEMLKTVRQFQLKTGARIYVGEFGCIRWAPGADRYLGDCIELFEEYGWDWTYHAFREWHGWDAELTDNPADTKTRDPENPRLKQLLNGFRKNVRPEPNGGSGNL